MTIRADQLHVDGAVLRAGTVVRHVATVIVSNERERNVPRVRVIDPSGRWWTVSLGDVE